MDPASLPQHLEAAPEHPDTWSSLSSVPADRPELDHTPVTGRQA